ncbi:MAG: DUF4328 domain-containing protein [Ilumatobacteraceae bacterium]
MSDVPPPPGATPPPTPPPPPPGNLAPPAGYVAFDAPPTQAGIKRIGGLAKAIVILTAILAVSTVITALLSAGVTQDAKDFLDGSISEDDFTTAIAPLNAVQLVTSLATLATGVLTIMWAYRIATNVRAFGRATTWSPLFAIFGWFLPPMVLYVIPFLVLRELWKASDSTSVDGTDRWKQEPDNRVLWLWLAVFGIIPTVLLAVQIGNFASAGIPSGNMESVAESLEDFAAIGYITAVVNVVAAATWIVFVRQLTERHVRLSGES